MQQKQSKQRTSKENPSITKDLDGCWLVFYRTIAERLGFVHGCSVFCHHQWCIFGWQRSADCSGHYCCHYGPKYLVHHGLVHKLQTSTNKSMDRSVFCCSEQFRILQIGNNVQHMTTVSDTVGIVSLCLGYLWCCLLLQFQTTAECMAQEEEKEAVPLCNPTLSLLVTTIPHCICRTVFIFQISNICDHKLHNY